LDWSTENILKHYQHDSLVLFDSPYVPPSYQVGIESKLKSVAFESIFAKKLPFLDTSYYSKWVYSISVSSTFLFDTLDYSDFGFPSFLQAFNASINPLWLSASLYAPSAKLLSFLPSPFSSSPNLTYFFVLLYSSYTWLGSSAVPANG